MSKRREPENKEKSELIRQLIREYKPQSVADIQAMLKDMFADVLQKSLEAEMDEELGYSKYDYRNKGTDNTRNGYSGKTLKTSMGEVELKVPRDRNGDFEPQIIKKRQTTMPNDLEDRIISMYAKGMTTADIEAHMADVYGIEISDTMVSRITDNILPVIREWQQRPLEEIYAVLFMDAIVYPVRKDGIIVKKAVYIAIGIDLEGKKDVLGMWIGENESARFWAGILNEIKNRGVKDIMIACIDGLSGFTEAISGVYPKTEIQQCIIHQIRNSTKHVAYKDLKPLMADLKRVYHAPSQDIAFQELEMFDETWSNKYPRIARSWRENWTNLSAFFKYPQELRTLIYTTNAIEGFNRQLRKVTKNRSVFPSDESLLKMLYLAMMDITRKWTGRRKDWNQIYAQIEIFFGDRLPA